jgi:6-pyruvoyltetrahydropterin/6-carboxytetrahydropterin synthase
LIILTRRYRLAAAHVLAQPAFSAGENVRIFGKCANPGGHGHDYEFEISVAGPLDPETGQIIAPRTLDEIFEDTIAARFAHTMLNDVEPFDTLVPTAENIAAVSHALLQDVVAHRSAARVVHVRVVETPRNFAEIGDVR